MFIPIFTIARVLSSPDLGDMRDAYDALPKHACVTLARAVRYVLDDAKSVEAGEMPAFRDILHNATEYFGPMTPNEPAQSRDPFQIVGMMETYSWLIGLTWLDTSNRPDGTEGYQAVNPDAQEIALRRAVLNSHREFNVGPVEGTTTGRMSHDGSHIEQVERALAPSAAEVVGEVVVPNESPLNNATIEEN